METKGETEGETEGETSGEASGETEGETSGETYVETKGEASGETYVETEGEAYVETEGETEGETYDETYGETEGEPSGQSYGEIHCLTPEGPVDLNISCQRGARRQLQHHGYQPSQGSEEDEIGQQVKVEPANDGSPLQALETFFGRFYLAWRPVEQSGPPQHRAVAGEVEADLLEGKDVQRRPFSSTW